ncbi:MAG: ABC transporter ATP-binding protein [Planctomycetota bacterium]|nr:ABC transporter ATP-binding protein [Planctomycetota bacterium]
MSDVPSIELQAVSRWYGEVLGLNEVSVQFGPGVTGLLGPNGAGKSTMLKIICGMLKPDLGTALVCGRKPFNRPRVMRRVGLCPEQDAFYPKASAWRVVAYLTQLHGFTKAEARTRARQALERAGLGEVLDRSVAGFSKGMRQRFKLAQALAHDPDVYVLDEPLNGLDPSGRAQYGAVIEELADEGCCVLVSSHILHEVDALARRIVVLHAGRVLAEGSAREIREDLAHFPLQVRVTTPEPARLASALADVDGVTQLDLTPSGLVVLTSEAALLLDRVAALTAETDIAVDAVVPLDEDLESVFRYLTQ